MIIVEIQEFSIGEPPIVGQALEALQRPSLVGGWGIPLYPRLFLYAILGPDSDEFTCGPLGGMTT